MEIYKNKANVDRTNRQNVKKEKRIYNETSPWNIYIKFKLYISSSFSISSN